MQKQRYMLHPGTCFCLTLTGFRRGEEPKWTLHYNMNRKSCHCLRTGTSCRLPGKLSVTDKHHISHVALCFKNYLGGFFCFQPHIDIFHYEISSAITNELMPIHLILIPTTNQCELQAIFSTKNRTCNFHKTASWGCHYYWFLNLKYLMMGVERSHFIAFTM